MTTLPNFEWNRSPHAVDVDHNAVKVGRDILITEVPRHSMYMRLFLVPSDEPERFNVHAWTCIEDALPSYWVGSRPVTLTEFEVLDDPYRYGFDRVTCVRDGLDLVCTPWSYRYSWEGPQGMEARRGEPVRLVGVLRVIHERFYPHSPKLYEFVGFEPGANVLGRVCEIIGVDPKGRTLLGAESGRAWTLELSSGSRLWQVS